MQTDMDRVGPGATFSFSIPCISRDTLSVHNAPAIKAAANSNKNIAGFS